MPPIFVNEVRLPLQSILELKAFKYQAPGLRSRHKKKLEFRISCQISRLGIFDGDVLFFIPNQNESQKDENRILSKFLSDNIRNFSSKTIQEMNLKQIPIRVLERLIFSMISNQAFNRGIYTIYGRTFFKPTPQKGKRAHLAIETTLFVEDNIVKVYLTPTFIGLVYIDDTLRRQRYDLELVGLCKHRVGCELSKDNVSCPYISPGKLGYYSSEMLIEKLPDDRKDGFRNAFLECPKIDTIQKTILVKATTKAKNVLAFPPFVVNAKFSKTDLEAEIKTARAYRKATLMLSENRFITTHQRIVDLFDMRMSSSDTISLGLKINDVILPVSSILDIPHSSNIDGTSKYKAIQIPLQKNVNDMQNPTPLPQSGGWLFAQKGAYDRNDINRVFDEIRPYMIIPEELIHESRTLLHLLSDGEYKSRANYDQDFVGVNQDQSKEKYNTRFVNIWEEEEDFFIVKNKDVDYWKYVQEVKRAWSTNINRDLNRIAIVVVPSTDEDDENSLYYRLKKVFIEEGIPSQFISTETLHKVNNNHVAFGPILHSLWQNIYTKMGGKPWRLASQLGNVHAFIGVGFGLNPHKQDNHIFAGVAHIFDKYGSWIDIASGFKDISDDERYSFDRRDKYAQGTSSFKISRNVTQSIIYDALRLYQDKQSVTGEPANNIVLHKLGKIYECEVLGFLEGITQTLGTLENCHLGIVQIEQDHHLRLYGGLDKSDKRVSRTVVRGGGLVLNRSKVVLATTGLVYRGGRNKYPGIGTPQPLLLTSIIPSPNILNQYKCNSDQFYNNEELSKHVMALTQLHWGSTKENVRLPITTLYAQKVADLISKTGAKVDTWSSYHRPWFL